ncbi:aldolase [Microlunatus endophyticus]|uniref:Aldolase n=1 Tax=Microlunatus endophyticus TaxID=1716077 RepID=A0A917SIE7_9ACTN|nr:deoxyribose-phosphate aldolase [Microlunatus endophyticus]GGL81589.1 aldolase [Microlunatus endophyticus]
MTEISDLTDIRLTDPGRIGRLLAERSRPGLPADGRLMIIACDHPARGSLSALGRPTAMADRPELLRRLVTALSRPGVDGVLATADILEDLLLLGALEGKIVFSSLNRGGLSGSCFEADDRMTGYDVRGTVESGFDGAKMLLRIVVDDPATASTLQACGQAVTELNRAGHIALVEPFLARHTDAGRIANDLTPEAVITSIAIAQGLGASSAYTWLKLPVTDRMEEVAAATTLPSLLLGGDPEGSADETYAQWAAALKLPPIRGLVVGRSLLYPRDDDVAAAVDIAAGMVH